MTTIRATIEKLRELYEAEAPEYLPAAVDAMPALLEYVEKLERVAEAARRGVSFTIFKEPVVMHPQQLVELLTLAIRETESALDELDALDSEAFDRRNFTYSNDGRSITTLNTDDSYSFDPKDVKLITKP